MSIKNTEKLELDNELILFYFALVLKLNLVGAHAELRTEYLCFKNFLK